MDGNATRFRDYDRRLWENCQVSSYDGMTRDETRNACSICLSVARVSFVSRIGVNVLIPASHVGCAIKRRSRARETRNWMVRTVSVSTPKDRQREN